MEKTGTAGFLHPDIDFGPGIHDLHADPESADLADFRYSNRTVFKADPGAAWGCR